MPIKDLLIGKPRDEAARIKATEIAKLDLSGQYNDLKTGIKVEIVSMSKFGENGIEVLAKAWNGAKQYGFGRDGSVEIERFRIINLPLLVADGTKKSITLTDRKTGEKTTIEVDNYEENPQEAIRQSLTETIRLIGKLDSKIQKDKIGSTTLTAYPYNDGMVNLNDATTGWANVRDATTGNEVFDTRNDALTGDNAPGLREDSGAGDYDIFRTGFVFDTSSIGTDDIDSAVFSIRYSAKADGDNDGLDYISCVSFTPNDIAEFAIGDYDAFGTTSYDTPIDIGSISTVAYNDFTFNATGEAAINKTGYTSFGQREGHDIENSAIANLTNNRVSTIFSDTLNTTSDPKLVVVHSASGGGGGAMPTLSLLGVG